MPIDNNDDYNTPVGKARLLGQIAAAPVSFIEEISRQDSPDAGGLTEGQGAAIVASAARDPKWPCRPPVGKPQPWFLKKLEFIL